MAIENAKSLAREAIGDFAKMEKTASWTKDQILIEGAHKAFCLHGKVDATAAERAGGAAKAAASMKRWP